MQLPKISGDFFFARAVWKRERCGAEDDLKLLSGRVGGLYQQLERCAVLVNGAWSDTLFVLNSSHLQEMFHFVPRHLKS